MTFIDLRDREGVTQVVFHPEDAPTAHAAAQELRGEWVVRIQGAVRARPDGMANPALATGEIEVAAAALEVLNRAETPPFVIEDRIEADEQLRLQYRYLDLRRPEMTRILRLRADVNRIMREHMDAPRLPRGGDADPHALDAGGGARLPRALTDVPRHLLRAAAVAAAAETAA